MSALSPYVLICTYVAKFLNDNASKVNGVENGATFCTFSPCKITRGVGGEMSQLDFKLS